MREIKFRAWYKPEGKYIEWEGMYGLVREAGDKVAVHIAIADQCFAMADEIELEQFTGLKDCNGRDIYEGDILECVKPHLEEREIYVVSWCEEDTKFEATRPGKRGHPFGLGDLNPRFWKVGGNIHETIYLKQEESWQPITGIT